MRRWLMTTVVLAAGCASAHSPAPTVEPGQPEVEGVREKVFDDAPLHDARDALRDDDFGTATTLADSLLEAWTGAEELDSGSAGDLVDLLTAVGAEDGAARLLFHAPFDLDGGERGTLRRLSGRLSISELQKLLAESDGGVRQRSIISAELARALAIADHPERAAELADRSAQRASHITKAAGPKEQQDDQQEQQRFRHPYLSKHVFPLWVISSLEL